MDPLEILSDEHRLIQRYLDLLAKAQELIAQGRPVSITFFKQGLQFAREFVDEYHHFKEEDVLFALVDQKGTGDIGDEIEILRNQHERGRALIKEIASTVAGNGLGESARASRLMQGLEAYTALVREHIHLEDDLIFPHARRSLTPEEMEVLRTQYESERRRFGRDTLERNQQLVADMGSLLAQ